MAFRLRQDSQDWFSKIDGKPPIRTKFDLFYFCLLAGLMSGRRTDPAQGGRAARTSVAPVSRHRSRSPPYRHQSASRCRDVRRRAIRSAGVPRRRCAGLQQARFPQSCMTNSPSGIGPHASS